LQTRRNGLFAINTRATKIECYTKEFYQYIGKKFSQELEAKGTAVKLVKPKNIDRKKKGND
jgi:hypothetical protein